MADPTGSNYAFGAPRHAPRPDVAAPDLDPKRPNHAFSNPAGQTQSWNSTGAIMNAAGHRNRKSPKAAGPVAAGPEVESPLDLSGVDDIVEASGLGRPSSELTAGERMSDADPPSQGVHEDENGDLVHYRANPSGSVTRNPVGARSTTSYGASAPDWFAEG